jgi:hypothetical protein
VTATRSALHAAVYAAGLVAGICGSASGQDPARREGIEEAPLTLLYRPYVRTIIAALQRDGAFYLPVRETLTQLHIDNQVDPRKNAATGYFIDQRRAYHVDFAARTARVGEKHYVLAPGSSITTELDVFILPSVLEQLFGLRIAVDARMLAVEITASEILPVAEVFRRRERQARLTAASARTAAPLRYARDRRVLDGGVLQYLLAAESVDKSDVVRFHFDAGAELFGGDFQGSVFGSHGPNRRRDLQWDDWRWRYVFGQSRYVSQMTVGQLSASGLVFDELQGVELTNQPLEPRSQVGTYGVDGVTEPNAEVELYLNDVLVDVARADQFGEYRFTVPLSYGTSVVRVQSYGAGGTVRREEHAVQLPFTFVPRGRADYVVTAGRSQKTRRPAAHGRIAIGLSQRITSAIGVDYRVSDSARRPLAYGSISARPGSGYVVGVDVAPGALYRVATETFHRSRATVGAMVTRYRGDALLQPAGASDEWSLRGFAPLGGGATSATLQVRADHRRSRSGSRSSNLAVDARSQTGLVRLALGYSRTSANDSARLRSSLQQRGRLGLSSYIGRLLSGRRWLRGALLSGWQTYDLDGGMVRDVQVQLTAPLAVGRYFEASVTRDYVTRTSRVDLQLLLELASIRSATRAIQSHNERTLTQTLRGAVGYDSRSHVFVANDRSWAGHSGVTMRFFLDRDGDGTFDADEEPVRGATIRLHHPVTLEDVAIGVIRATDLAAYRRYSAVVDVSGVRNPLLMPKFREFAFETDPNRYKRIDVPFFVGGVLEGSVVRRIGTDDRPVAGLKLHLRSVSADIEADLVTFSDGTFYHMGVPPGRYVLQVDSTQLELLGTVAEPSVRTFEVRESASGDFIERLDFVLVPANHSDTPTQHYARGSI